ncbi:MAG: glycosyltransferase [Saprospiraceae bacterium]
MLSILIPIYNFNVVELVMELHRQATELDEPVEILAFDDGSEGKWKALNRSLKDVPGVHYRELEKNKGRAAIRNYLARRANFEFLLFLDCDSGIVREDFLKTYLDYLPGHPLVYGGRVYKDEPPQNPKLYFHWYYGRFREQMDVATRKARPWHSFMTNNFVIDKALFLSIGFEESLTQYGHEDTLFGMELARRQVQVLHIDNPVEHLGLEPVEIFLRKTDQAIENLLFLRKTGRRVDTRLMNTLEAVERWKMSGLVRSILSAMWPLIKKNIYGRKVRLKAFDLYKLYKALCIEAPRNPKL